MYVYKITLLTFFLSVMKGIFILMVTKRSRRIQILLKNKINFLTNLAEGAPNEKIEKP